MTSDEAKQEQFILNEEHDSSGHLMWSRKKYFKGTKNIYESIDYFIDEGICLLKTLKMGRF